MPLLFKYEGHTLDVDDLDIDVMADIFMKTGKQWWQVTTSPYGSDVARPLVTACCKELGIEPPVKLSLKVLVKMFEFVDGENRPVEYEDGIPDPKAADTDQATT